MQSVVKTKGIIVVFSPLLRPVAADLESKLSESALLYCQLADLRSLRTAGIFGWPRDW